MSHYSDKHYIVSNDFDKFYYSIMFKRGDKILDIGCSTGNFVIQDPKNIIGIDLDEDALKIAKKRNLKVFRHDLGKKLPFKDGTIDNVNCRHVLEHLKDPFFFMRDLFRILKKNGKLVLVTDQFTPHFWDDYTHKRPFTKKSLYQLAYDAGFRNYNIHYFPSRGVFAAGFLHKHKLISTMSAKKIYLVFGRVFNRKNLLLEALK